MHFASFANAAQPLVKRRTSVPIQGTRRRTTKLSFENFQILSSTWHRSTVPCGALRCRTMPYDSANTGNSQKMRKDGKKNKAEIKLEMFLKKRGKMPFNNFGSTMVDSPERILLRGTLLREKAQNLHSNVCFEMNQMPCALLCKSAPI